MRIHPTLHATVWVLTIVAFQPLLPSRAAGELGWTNPIVPQRADPHVTLEPDGTYYLIATVPEYDRIELRRANSIGGLSTAEPVVIWKKPASGPMSGFIWAPELHKINGTWYIYFAASEAKDGLENPDVCAREHRVGPVDRHVG